jgi:hypothetical protein
MVATAVEGDYPMGSSYFSLNLAPSFTSPSIYNYNYFQLNWDQEIITLPSRSNRMISSMATTETQLTPGAAFALESRNVGLHTFDRGTRSLYYVSVRQTSSYLVQYDVTNDQIIAYKQFKDRAFVTLDFDQEERRLLAVTIYAGQFDICSFYVDQNMQSVLQYIIIH